MTHGTTETPADDRWNIKGRWLDITDLGTYAEILLLAIRDKIPQGHISPRYVEPPKWQVSLLYELVRSKMSQEALARAIKELHQKNILLMAFAHHSPYAKYARVSGLYQNPKTLHAAIQEATKTSTISLSDLLRVEIYLVLPEDNTIIK